MPTACATGFGAPILLAAAPTTAGVSVSDVSSRGLLEVRPKVGQRLGTKLELQRKKGHYQGYSRVFQCPGL